LALKVLLSFNQESMI